MNRAEKKEFNRTKVRRKEKGEIGIYDASINNIEAGKNISMAFS